MVERKIDTLFAAAHLHVVLAGARQFAICGAFNSRPTVDPASWEAIQRIGLRTAYSASEARPRLLGAFEGARGRRFG
jgi:hypothetical protein